MKTDRQKVICFGLICLLSYDIIASKRSLGDSQDNPNPHQKGGEATQEESNPQPHANYGQSQLHKDTQEQIASLKETVEKTDKHIGEINKELSNLKKEKDGSSKERAELNKKKENLRKEADKVLENLNELYQKLSHLEANNIVKDPESIAAQKKEIEQYIQHLKAEQELDRRLGDIKDRLDRADSLSPIELKDLKKDIVQLRNDILNTVESSNGLGVLTHRSEDKLTDSLAALDRNEKTLENLSRPKTDTPSEGTSAENSNLYTTEDSLDNTHRGGTNISEPSKTPTEPKQDEHINEGLPNITNYTNSSVLNSLDSTKTPPQTNFSSKTFQSKQSDSTDPLESSKTNSPRESFTDSNLYVKTGESRKDVNSNPTDSIKNEKQNKKPGNSIGKSGVASAPEIFRDSYSSISQTNVEPSLPSSEQLNIKGKSFRPTQSEILKSNTDFESLSLWKKENLGLGGIRQNVAYAKSDLIGLEEESITRSTNTKLKEPFNSVKGDSNKNTNVQYEIVDLNGNFAVTQPKVQQPTPQETRRGLASIEVSEPPPINIEATTLNSPSRGISNAIEVVRNLKESSNSKTPTGSNKVTEPIELFLPTVLSETIPDSDITQLISPQVSRKIAMKFKTEEKLSLDHSGTKKKESDQPPTTVGLWQRFKTKILSWF